MDSVRPPRGPNEEGAEPGHSVRRLRGLRALPRPFVGCEGLPLYGTFWADLLDASADEIDSLAFAASQRGMMEYRRMGEVAEFGFSGLLARTEGLARG